jgi:RNA polymerase sigma-70 factor, ECF subfamily
MENAVLLEKLKKGDRSAFNDLVKEHSVHVINICYRFLLDRDDAEDVAQEVFIEVFHSLKNFRGESKLSTWIYRIAACRSMDEIKKRNRKKRFTSIGKAIGLDQIAHWVSSHDRPDKTMEDKEKYSSLLKALNSLPENQRIALTLSKIEGYTNSEVAEIMQTSTTAVESLIYRAKQNLKNFLGS